MSGGHCGRPVTATVLTSHLPRWVSLTGRPWVHPPLGQTGLPAIQEGTGHGEVPAKRLYPPPPRHPCTSMLGCPPCILDRGRHLGLEGAVLIPPKPAQSCTPWDSQHGCPTHRGRDACIQLTSNFNTQPPRDPESGDARRPVASTPALGGPPWTWACSSLCFRISLFRPCLGNGNTWITNVTAWASLWWRVALFCRLPDERFTRRCGQVEK